MSIFDASPVRPRFLAGVFGTFCLGLLWLFMVALSEPGSASMTYSWIRHDVVHTMFHLLVLPPIAGLVCASLTPDFLGRFQAHLKRRALALLAVLLLIPVVPALTNMNAQPRAPFMMRDAASRIDAYALDACLRRWIAGAELPTDKCASKATETLATLRVKEPPKFNAEEDPQSAADEATDYRRRAAFKTYVEVTDTTYNSTRLAERTAAHWLTLSLTWLGASTGAALLWLLFACGLQDNLAGPEEKSRLVVAVLLFLLYIPLALYVDWYQHYYVFDDLADNKAKVIAIILCAVALVAVLFFIGNPMDLLPWTAGLAALGSSAAALAFPAFPQFVARFIDGLDMFEYAALAIPIAVVLYLLAAMYIRQAGATSVRASSTGP